MKFLAKKTPVDYRASHILIGLALSLVSIALFSLVKGTNAAFTSGITNSVNSTATAPFFDCTSAIKGVGASNTVFAYRLTGTDVSPSPNIIDIGGNNYTGVYKGTPASSNAAPAVCPNDKTPTYLQNGNIANYVVPGDNLAAVAPLSAFTYEMWIKTTTTTGGHLIGFTSQKSSTVTSSMNNRKLYMMDNGQIRGASFNTTTVYTTTPASYNDGQPHHIVYTMGPTGRRIYMDGVLVATNTNAVPDEAGNGWWVIGVGVNTGWAGVPTSRAFTGNIGFAAVYRRALTPQEVSDHYAVSKKWVTP